LRKIVDVDGEAQRIGQLAWLLFLKIFDDREQEWKLLDAKYKSPLPEKCRWRSRAAESIGNSLRQKNLWASFGSGSLPST
jgi:type I restriction enzyme M protein